MSSYQVDSARMKKDLATLVAINTENPPGHEREAAECLEGWLLTAGFDLSFSEYAPGRTNVIAVLHNGPGPCFAFNTHIDTVPAGSGADENALVSAMMGAAIAAGSEYVGMEPLVSTGPRSGVPHGTWRRRVMQDNDPVFLEMSAAHDRYHAAMMRSAWLGRPPAIAIEMEKVCQEALQAALDAIRPGATCEAPHLACQKVIDRAGFTENFKKRTGYSIGIAFAPDWGEGGILSLYSGVTTELQPGMTFHIPPALRIYGQFTVGVSETVVVTETGYRQLGSLARPLTLL